MQTVKFKPTFSQFSKYMDLSEMCDGEVTDEQLNEIFGLFGAEAAKKKLAAKREEEKKKKEKIEQAKRDAEYARSVNRGNISGQKITTTQSPRDEKSQAGGRAAEREWILNLK